MAAIERLLALRATTATRFHPKIPDGLDNTWRAVAERGLFAFDCPPGQQRYRLVAAPLLATRASALPAEIHEVARRIRCRVVFADQTVLDAESATHAPRRR